MSATSCSASAMRPTRSSRSAKARWRSSTPPGTSWCGTDASGFLGELNLLSGQTVFLTAVVTKPMRYIAVEPRRAPRASLRGRAALRSRALHVHRPPRSAPARPGDRRRDRRAALVGRNDADARFRSREPAPVHVARRRATENAPLVRLPGGTELQQPSRGDLLRALGVGRELAAREEVDLLVVGAGPAGLAAAVYGASEGLDTLVVESTALGGQAGSSRRIENYLGFPAGISGTELTSRAVSQARKFGARPATPYRATRARARRRAARRPARRRP